MSVPPLEKSFVNSRLTFVVFFVVARSGGSDEAVTIIRGEETIIKHFAFLNFWLLPHASADLICRYPFFR